MGEREHHPLRPALRQMFEDNIWPYRAVGESVARGIAREKAERAWWNQFLPGQSGPASTLESQMPGRGEVRISYAPDIDGAPAPGEIVWTWVPTDALPDGGRYSPVLLLGSHDRDRLYGVRLTTASHEGDHRFFPLGAGPKHSHGRMSWADLDHIFSVHVDGMHRERFVMARGHFTRVADELYLRHGWPMED